MVEVRVDMDRLMEILDEHEGGKLFPILTGEEQIVRVEVRKLDVCFIIGKSKP